MQSRRGIAPGKSGKRKPTFKSGKQRKVELQARKADKRAANGPAAKSAAARRAEVIEAQKLGVAVNASLLAPDGSYGIPPFVERGYYVDTPFQCQKCGKDEVWSARQQKWWYEVAKGNVWTTARYCRPCRRRERERRDEARRIHLEGLARKQQRGKRI